MTTNVFGRTLKNLESTIIVDLVVDTSVAGLDPVYYNQVSAKWEKANSLSATPTGVFEKETANEERVIISGILHTSGLISGAFYYLDDGGGLTTVPTNTYIGRAIGSTKLNVSIEVKDAFYQNSIKTGYVSGTYPLGSPVNATTAEKLVFSTEVTSEIVSKFSIARNEHSGYGSDTKGYFVGGDTEPTNVSYITSLTFATENTADVTSLLLEARRAPVALSSDYSGYALRGSPPGISTIEKLTFASENSLDVVSNANQSGDFGFPFTTASHGIYAGISLTSSVEKIVFDTDIVSLLTAKLINNHYGYGSAQNKINGYLFSAIPGTTNIEKFVFSTESNTSVINAKLQENKQNCGGMDSNSDGFCIGGSFNSRIEKLNFAVESLSLISSDLISPGPPLSCHIND